MFLEISQNSQENICARDSFFKKVAGLIKKETPEQMFFCELCEISKNTFFTKHLRKTASEYSYYNEIVAILVLKSRADIWLFLKLSSSFNYVAGETYRVDRNYPRWKQITLKHDSWPKKHQPITNLFFTSWFWVSKYVLIIFAYIFGRGMGLVYLGMTLRFLHQFPSTLRYIVFFLQVISMFISLINDYRTV